MYQKVLLDMTAKLHVNLFNSTNGTQNDCEGPFKTFLSYSISSFVLNQGN